MIADPGGDADGGNGGSDRDRVNAWLAAINPVTKRLVAERTSYSSQLIPVTPYVTVSCIEAFLRYPEAVATITAAMSPEEIGAAARRPGCQVDSVFLWGLANFFLIGRNVMAMVDPTLDSVERTHTVLDFWARASRAYRGGRHLHAAEVGNRLDVFHPDMVSHLAAGAGSVDDERRDRIRRANATIINHLFLLYFDTRVGHADTGPYRLDDGRTLIVRDFYRLAESDFSWSGVAADVPHRNLTAALVLGPDLMDHGADGIVAVIRDAGATFLGPIFEELAGVVCTGGTIRSHIGIISREYRIPGVIAAGLTYDPEDGTEVELDGSGDEGVISLVAG